MSLLTPDIGLIFWTSLSFLIVLLLLARWGFPAILHAVEERRQTIAASLEAAAEARSRVAQAQAECERMLLETRGEQARLTAEAEAARRRMLADAQVEAAAEAARILAEARREIGQKRAAAQESLRREALTLACGISRKALGAELQSTAAQEQFTDRIVHG